MPDFTILDILLVLALVGYLVAGLRNGFLVTLGGIAGFVAGAIAAFFAIPLVSEWVPDDAWRLPAIILTAFVLVVLGQALGSRLGGAIRRALDFRPIRMVDRLLGGVVNVVVAALVMSMLAFSIGTLGMPFLSQSIASSQVIRGIDNLTPSPVRTWMAQLRTIAVDDGIPTILESVAPAAPLPVPEAAVDTPELASASQSVLRIAGTAFQCGQNQTGSGFIIAPGRVVTNAHVVAGVNEPVVEIPGGGALPGRIVHFDAVRDIAVLAVDGLDRAPLPLGEDLATGDTAAFAGYPAGGPFQIQPASIQNRSDVLVANIYGADPASVNVYSLAANVQQGNSGGPLLDMQGRVTGVIFAKSTQDAPVGYALTLAELQPIAEQASVFTDTVSAGQCNNR
ncbi:MULTISPECIES: MarP family serine protease [unclassified Arthrobacter]|uniref:MarP family serine protease n=1 Tax=unclassified Arthrobacter TaxID=235627 RepID=UPI00030EDE38|nr:MULTISPECIES: MarP family serine protease [unclassified Arthrobacter]PVE17423.1 serine protease [Arthrobacter sp. Bz4]